MLDVLLAGLLILSAAPDVAGNEVQVKPVEAPMSRLFIVHLSLGKAWNAEKPAQEQLHFKEHSANIKRLRTEGRLRIGARYGDKGMLILTAQDEPEVRAEFAQDPMVMNGLFQLDISELRPFYDGCTKTP